MEKYLCCADMGATNIKIGLYSFNGKQISLANSIVFDNKPVYVYPSLYWNFFSLYDAVITGLQTFSVHKKPCSLGIDSWGATFGFLNAKGQLAEPLFHYRDLRTKDILSYMENIYSKKNVFYKTGCQPARTYSLPQLVSIAQAKESILHSASGILFLPDLISYFLCGAKTTELSFAGTTALLDIKNNTWSKTVLNKFKIPQSLFTKIVNAGTIKGTLLPAVAEHYNLAGSIPIVSVCSHDTASAVTSVPGFDEKSIYISFGTNINMGVETDIPCVSDEAFDFGLKNTGGFAGKNLLYKDFSAGWFITKLQKAIEKTGVPFSFGKINTQVQKLHNKNYIDVEDPNLNNDTVSIKSEINAYLQKTKQQNALNSDAEYMGCVYESIVLKIKHTVNAFQKLFNNKFTKLYVISGGSNNSLLAQFICNATGMPVYAGNPNASALGNALVQLYALKELSSLTEIRELSRVSCKMKELYPSAAEKEKWDEKFEICIEKNIL